MQSTGHSSTHARSLMSTHGWAMTYVTLVLLVDLWLPQPSITGGPDAPAPRPSSESSCVSTRHGLGPHCVGQRVVVRRLLRGRRGPSGGPAMTDLLGVMESWSSEATTVRAESGELVAIPVADIVTGKPVPPR